MCFLLDQYPYPFSLNVCACVNTTYSLVLRPLPPEEWPGTLCLRMCVILCYILHKKTLNLLTHVDWYVEYYTNQEYGLLFWHRDEMNDLTNRICPSAVETKHSTALFTATGLSQEWPT